MISKIFTITLHCIALCALGQSYTPSNDTLAVAVLIPFLSPANNYMFDGTASISHASTTPTTSRPPTLAQMQYYNYYSACVDCQYQLNDLDGQFCQIIKNDVYTFKVLNNDNTAVGALVTASKTRQEIVVAYRGSENIWNGVLDFTFLNIDSPCSATGIKLHQGFYIATMSLYDQVIGSVGYLRTLFPNYKIVITGHSMGAAMARVTQYILLCLEQFPGAIYEVYTYGEPRVGNQKFAEYINGLNITTARCTARADIVPHVPPTSILATDIFTDYYIHPQIEYWINGLNGAFGDTNVFEDPNCSESMGPAYTIIDHFTYFDANYALCIDQPAVALQIPASVLVPVDTIPCFPPTISDFISAAIGFVFPVISPPLGR